MYLADELAHRDADQADLCIFAKTAKPDIHWYTGERKPEEITEYLRKVGVVGQAIADEEFQRRPGW